MYHDLYKYFTGHLDLKVFCLFLKALCMYNIDNIKKDKRIICMHNLQGNLPSGNFSHPDESTFPGLRLHGLELLRHNFSWLSSKHVPKKKFFNCVKTHVIIFSLIKNGPTLNNYWCIELFFKKYLSITSSWEQKAQRSRMFTQTVYSISVSI